jgi:hypothetical protein
MVVRVCFTATFAGQISIVDIALASRMFGARNFATGLKMCRGCL